MFSFILTAVLVALVVLTSTHYPNPLAYADPLDACGDLKGGEEMEGIGWWEVNRHTTSAVCAGPSGLWVITGTIGGGGQEPELVSREKDTMYVTHDIGSAYMLRGDLPLICQKWGGEHGVVPEDVRLLGAVIHRTIPRPAVNQYNESTGQKFVEVGLPLCRTADGSLAALVHSVGLVWTGDLHPVREWKFKTN